MYDLAESLSVRCGSRFVHYSPGQGGYFSRGAKYVFSISMPAIETSGATRKTLMKTYGMSSSFCAAHSADQQIRISTCRRDFANNILIPKSSYYLYRILLPPFQASGSPACTYPTCPRKDLSRKHHLARRRDSQALSAAYAWLDHGPSGRVLYSRPGHHDGVQCVGEHSEPVESGTAQRIQRE